MSLNQIPSKPGQDSCFIPTISIIYSWVPVSHGQPSPPSLPDSAQLSLQAREKCKQLRPNIAWTQHGCSCTLSKTIYYSQALHGPFICYYQSRIIYSTKNWFIQPCSSDPDPTDPGPWKKGCWKIFCEQNGGKFEKVKSSPNFSCFLMNYVSAFGHALRPHECLWTFLLNESSIQLYFAAGTGIA